MLSGMACSAESIHSIVIDGEFSDWTGVPSHRDPTAGPGVLHRGIPDTHDTDHSDPEDIPAFVRHPDVDLVEYKFTHDRENLYAYFRAAGEIGRTISTSRHGRYYVIVTIDVDQDTATGYGLHEGGYFPTSYGYDMNMEVEFYDGAFNTGHYLNHGARDQVELEAAIEDQRHGTVRIRPGSYDFYSQWVWFDSTEEGDYSLPPPNENASITFVEDRGPVLQGIIRIATSPDRHEAEMVAPFRGFMRDPSGAPILSVEKTINISFSLEASGELAPDREWASDTGDPILGYYLSPFGDPGLRIDPPGTDREILVSWNEAAMGMVLEQTTLLGSPWHPVTGSEATNRFSFPATDHAGFFRLTEPMP